jgi:hypothetical protein
MTKVLGIHEIELLPGIEAADFEQFITTEFLPLRGFEGWTAHLAKADRGARAGKYALILEIESTLARDRYSPGSNEFTEEGQRAVEQFAAKVAKWANFSATIPGQNTTFTDYVIVGE